MITHSKGKGFFWFRIKGYGMYIKNYKIHPLIFSQRNGNKGCVIGNYYLEFLRK